MDVVPTWTPAAAAVALAGPVRVERRESNRGKSGRRSPAPHDQPEPSSACRKRAEESHARSARARCDFGDPGSLSNVGVDRVATGVRTLGPLLIDSVRVRRCGSLLHSREAVAQTSAVGATRQRVRSPSEIDASGGPLAPSERSPWTICLGTFGHRWRPATDIFRCAGFVRRPRVNGAAAGPCAHPSEPADRRNRGSHPGVQIPGDA